jgi:hypothetical protein
LWAADFITPARVLKNIYAHVINFTQLIFCHVLRGGCEKVSGAKKCGWFAARAGIVLASAMKKRVY